MSEVRVNKLSPRSGTTVTLGDSGDTITIPSGVTLANSGTIDNLNASNLTSGTVPSARVSGAYTGITQTGTLANSGATVTTFNRTTSDGNILELQKDGTTVGSIGTLSGDLSIGTGDTGINFYDGGNQVLPFNTTTNNYLDNTIDLGSDGYRFNDLYLGGGLYVGGTAAANKLDDYEEGTWTPSAVSTGDWSGFASSTVTTYMAQYTKVGRKVSIQGQISFPDSTGNLTAGDSVKIGGLPFNYGGSGDNIYSKVPSQCFVRDGTNGGVSHNYLFNSNQITLRVVATHGSGARSQQGLNLSFTYFTD